MFFATEAEVARARAPRSLGYEVKTVSHDDDASRQLEAIEAAIADKAAFIILDNAGADATIEAVQAAYDAGIPCFLIDREINTTGIAVAQIVADNAQGAAAIAEKWVEAMNYEGKYAELLGLESDTNCPGPQRQLPLRHRPVPRPRDGGPAVRQLGPDRGL